jgi:hypothetical protein
MPPADDQTREGTASWRGWPVSARETRGRSPRFAGRKTQPRSPENLFEQALHRPGLPPDQVRDQGAPQVRQGDAVSHEALCRAATAAARRVLYARLNSWSCPFRLMPSIMESSRCAASSARASAISSGVGVAFSEPAARASAADASGLSPASERASLATRAAIRASIHHVEGCPVSRDTGPRECCKRHRAQ